MDSEDRSTQKDTSSSAVTSSLSDLIARLEKATGPDRELDAEIALAIGWTVRREFGLAGCWHDQWRDPGTLVCRLPRFTSSIDAAMTLIPDGWALGISTLAERPMVEIFERVNDRSFSLRADTLPLALCIAALKARSLPAI